MKFFSNRKQLSLSPVFILSVVVGLAGGIVGQLIADVYLNPWRDQYLIDLASQTITNNGKTPELRRLQRFLGIEQDFEVNKAVTTVAPAVVEIYLKKPATGSALGSVYLPKDLRAAGFIFTSDGWIITAKSAIEDVRRDQLVVIHSGSFYVVDQAVVDALSGTAFLKIAATNLPVVALGDSDDVALGQLGVVVRASQGALVTTIQDLDFRVINSASDYILTSEDYSYYWLLVSDGEAMTVGNPLVNLGGEVIGVVTGIDGGTKRANISPINQLRSVSVGMLRAGVISRPFLGVTYIDLARTPGLAIALTQGRERGALIADNPATGTPAALAGLKKNDIIVSVDGEPLDRQNDLVDLLQQYQPGDQLDLTLLRDHKDIDLTVTLGTLK